MATVHKEKAVAKDLHVVAIEGPAGAGKSTLVRELEHRGYVLPPSNYPRPREYIGIEGQRLSLLKDFNSLAFLLTTNAERVVLDRFILSAYIYEFIRQHRNAQPHEMNVESLIQSFDDWSSILDASSSLLDSWCQRVTPIVGGLVTWYIYMPPVEILWSRRNKAALEEGREFPFNAGQEHALYLEAFYSLQDKLDPPPGWDFELKLVHDVETVYADLR